MTNDKILMTNRGNLLLTIALALLVFGISFRAEAEELKVIWSLSGLLDQSRVEERPDITVHTSGIPSDMDKAKRIARTVIDREITHEDPNFGIISLLDFIKEVDGTWYLKYRWQYEKAYIAGAKMDRMFNIEVNLKRKIIVYERDVDKQFSDGTDKY